MFRKIKLVLGMIFGAAIGLLFAPKKGKDVRDYIASDEFKEKIVEAGMKVEGLKEEAQEKSKSLVTKIKSIIARIKNR
jgi:gas vesicle protein